MGAWSLSKDNRNEALRQSLRFSSPITADMFAGRMAEVFMSDFNKVAQLRSAHFDTKAAYEVPLKFLTEAIAANPTSHLHHTPPFQISLLL